MRSVQLRQFLRGVPVSLCVALPLSFSIQPDRAGLESAEIPPVLAFSLAELPENEPSSITTQTPPTTQPILTAPTQPPTVVATTAAHGQSTTSTPGLTDIEGSPRPSVVKAGPSSSSPPPVQQTTSTVVTSEPSLPPSETTTQPTPTAADPASLTNALFVDPDLGNDTADGSSAQPLRTPNRALQLASPGDTIILNGGDYSDLEGTSIDGTVNGTPSAWVTIRPAAGQAVTIEAGGSWENAIRLIDSSYVRIEGFNLRGRSDSVHGSGIRIDFDSHHIQINANDIRDFGGGGVSITRSDRVTIESNIVVETSKKSSYQASGISFWYTRGPGSGAEPANVIRGNLVVGVENLVPSDQGQITDGNCIIMDWGRHHSYAGSSLIENNVCATNGGRGVHILHTDNVVVRHNTLVNNLRTEALSSGGELSAHHASNVVFEDNLIVNPADRAAANVWNATSVSFFGNVISNGSLPNDYLLSPSGELALVGPVGSYTLAAYRPAASLPTKANDGPTFDALGSVRPGGATVGALEPVL